jgi:predicted CoA-binding protein
MKKTLVLGTSLKSNRYSNLAIHRLVGAGVETVAFGISAGKVGDVQVRTNLGHFQNIHTITLYLNPQRQQQYYQDIIGLRPYRVIFNPGTENPEFYEMLKDNGILVEVACTLVLLACKQF